MSGILLVAIAVYIGLYIYTKADRKLTTAVATSYTIETSGSADGYIVRTERLLTGVSGTMTVLASEGAKVSASETIAVSYSGDAALERANEIKSLQLQLASDGSDENGTSEASIKSSPADTVLSLAQAVQHQELNNLEKLVYNVKSTIFSSSATTLTDEQRQTLEDKLSALLADTSGMTTVTAPESGVFSSAIDGYESVTPDALQNLTPSSLSALFPANAPADTSDFGKLITEIKWYYAAVMSEDDVKELADKKTATLQFTKTYNKSLDMKVESIGAAENGQCVVIFSSKSNLSDMTTLRRLTADIVFSSTTGLLVPKEAVHQDDGGASYIFLLTGLQAEKVNIDILSETGSGYLVKDGTQNHTVLRAGSEIIVEGKDLYDKKVVSG